MSHLMKDLAVQHKYNVWWVVDTTIPKDDPNALDNQRQASFKWWAQLMWFCLRNPEVMASIKADRVRFITITDKPNT